MPNPSPKRYAFLHASFSRSSAITIDKYKALPLLVQPSKRITAAITYAHAVLADSNAWIYEGVLEAESIS